MQAPNGESATSLSGPMLKALHDLIAAHPAAGCVSNIRTSVALLNRGFIERAVPMMPLATDTLYNITQHGRTAYNIAKREALGSEE